MALIKCGECGKEVSSEATSCIYCGKPIKENIQTVQLTSKRWKIIKLIGALGLIIGFFLFVTHLGKGGFKTPYPGIGVMLFLLGLIVLIVGKFGAWWSNK